jgi:hypothetical protein
MDLDKTGFLKQNGDGAFSIGKLDEAISGSRFALE